MYCNSVIKESFSSSRVRLTLWIRRLRKKLHKGLKSSPITCGSQLVFHWVSKLIHLTRMRRSGWVTTSWIINELEKCVSQLAYRSRFSDGIFFIFIQLYFEKCFRKKVHATIPKGIVGVFEFTVLQRNLKEWHERPWTYVLEERNKSRFNSYSVRNSISYWSYAICRDCHVHIFPTTFLELYSSE